MAESSKTSVSRTISAGNNLGTITDIQSQSAGFPFARRHSSAGILALKWATTRSSSLGSSLGFENRGSKDSIHSFVVTPDSIPQFTIPKLALEDGFRVKGSMKVHQGAEEEEDCGSTYDISPSSHPRLSLSSSLSSSSSSSSISPLPGRRVIPDKRLHALSGGSFASSQCSDPASRAALSLPHLPKVTTPYGFVTLSKSPQMADEEALFFQVHRRWGQDEDKESIIHPKLELKRSTQMTARSPPHQSPIIQRFFRSHSIAGIEIQKQPTQTKCKESVKPATDLELKEGPPTSPFAEVFTPTFCNAAHCPIHLRYEHHHARFFSEETPPPIPKKSHIRTRSFPGETLYPTCHDQTKIDNYKNPLYMVTSLHTPNKKEEAVQEEHQQVLRLAKVTFGTPDEELQKVLRSHKTISTWIQDSQLQFLRNMLEKIEAGTILSEQETETAKTSQPHDFILCGQMWDDFYLVHSPKFPSRMFAAKVRTTQFKILKQSRHQL
ncbi:hypothetical protein DNTS_025872 [Danionella cerebrum]|uniref:Uncharacterized protein n=1 Tax=Danionella cerebrum TaxID=2873325 RepID=A0A553NA73_9TELE|nr:hypothetical protein DNTS_025872 [Danionella translucida]